MTTRPGPSACSMCWCGWRRVVILDREGPNVGVGEAEPTALGAFSKATTSPVIGLSSTNTQRLCQTMPAPPPSKEHPRNTTKKGKACVWPKICCSEGEVKGGCGQQQQQGQAQADPVQTRRSTTRTPPHITMSQTHTISLAQQGKSSSSSYNSCGEERRGRARLHYCISRRGQRGLDSNCAREPEEGGEVFASCSAQLDFPFPSHSRISILSHPHRPWRPRARRREDGPAASSPCPFSCGVRPRLPLSSLPRPLPLPRPRKQGWPPRRRPCQ